MKYKLSILAATIIIACPFYRKNKNITVIQNTDTQTCARKLDSLDKLKSAYEIQLDTPVTYSNLIKNNIEQYKKNHTDIDLFPKLNNDSIVGIIVYANYDTGRYDGMDIDISNLVK